jgi:hypothetical protein
MAFSTTNVGLLFRQSDGKIYPGKFVAGPTYFFGSEGYSVSTGVWYRIDMKVVTSANPWTVDVQVNGTSLAQYTSASAVANDNNIAWGESLTSTATWYIDDVIVSSNIADYPIGGGYVNHFVPVSDGSHNVASSNDFERGTTGVDIDNTTTTAYNLVDDVPLPSGAPTDDSIGIIAPPNSTDYVECVFGPASGISTPTTAPRAVQAVIARHEAGTGTCVGSHKLNDGGTVSSILDISGAGATSFNYATKQFATAPSGGAWTLAKFNALRLRTGYSSDANPDLFLDACMIEAEFAPTTAIKTIQGTLKGSVKSVNGLLIGSMKSLQGLE